MGNIMTGLRDMIAEAIYGVMLPWDGFPFNQLTDTAKAIYLEQADAVMEVITAHVPPIVASAIQGYAQSELVAMSYHGDPAGLASMKRLNREAAGIAQYATTHEDWNGEMTDRNPAK
jgi:hypothetical protein